MGGEKKKKREKILFCLQNSSPPTISNFHLPFFLSLPLFPSSSFSPMLREVTAARPALVGARGRASSPARPAAAAAAPSSARKMALVASPSSSSSGGRSFARLQRVRAISTEQPPVVSWELLLLRVVLRLGCTKNRGEGRGKRRPFLSLFLRPFFFSWSRPPLLASERAKRAAEKRRALGRALSLSLFFFFTTSATTTSLSLPLFLSLAAGARTRKINQLIAMSQKTKNKMKHQRESDILSSIDQPLPVYSSVDGSGSGGDPTPSTRRPRVVVLGSGWGAMSFVKALSESQAREIDLTVISPRNYFLYTPLLPAVATGTVEERSIVEPVRKVLGSKGAYFEAVCHSIDPEAKKLVCW